MIKAIIFDCFGVLTKDWWREFLSTLPEGPGKKKAKELNHQWDAGLITIKQFVQGVHEATGRQPEPIEQMMTVPKVLKNTELLDYIRTLKPLFKIGLLSNIGTNWIRENFLTKDEQKLFDDLVFSYEIGVIKPEPKIYQIAAERLSVAPKETVFIDDVNTYCLAAQGLGFKTINYKDFSQMKQELEKILAADSDN
ncbi:MAG TPA: HAD family phosphatase [Candidatus Babeliales bacterium]|nr:HAD family phosphatase [Candidatus Babeliales bacterium]